MIKIVFFDLDNTLLSHRTNRIPESAIKAIKQLQRQGILCFLATGRNRCLIPQEVDDLALDGMMTLNGQVCFAQNKEVLYSFPLTPEDQATAVKYFNEKKIGIGISEKDRLYYNCLNENILSMQKNYLNLPVTVDDYRGGEIIQLIVHLAKGKDQEFLNSFHNVKVARWSEDYGFDLFNRKGGKAAGIKLLLTKLHLKEEETLAFGDNQNDVDMLNYVHLAIAMGNATAVAKEAADYITADIDDDGIYRALKHFKLID